MRPVMTLFDDFIVTGGRRAPALLNALAEGNDAVEVIGVKVPRNTQHMSMLNAELGYSGIYNTNFTTVSNDEHGSLKLLNVNSELYPHTNSCLLVVP